MPPWRLVCSIVFLRFPNLIDLASLASPLLDAAPTVTRTPYVRGAPSRMLKKSFLPRLPKKVQMQGGRRRTE